MRVIDPIDPNQYTLQTFIEENLSPKRGYSSTAAATVEATAGEKGRKKSDSCKFPAVKRCTFDNAGPLGMSIIHRGDGILVSNVAPKGYAATQNVEVGNCTVVSIDALTPSDELLCRLSSGGRCSSRAEWSRCAIRYARWSIR